MRCLSVQPEVCLAMLNLRRKSMIARDVSRARCADVATVVGGGAQDSLVGRAHLALVARCKWCKWWLEVRVEPGGRA